LEETALEAALAAGDAEQKYEDDFQDDDFLEDDFQEASIASSSSQK